jgi:ubiquinone/menaquinone biosynthesis C-methylase UbiE
MMDAEAALPSGGPELEALYDARFTAEERAFMADVWRILWRRVLSRYISPDEVLVDVGGGSCEFINAAVTRRRIVVDLNPRVRERAAQGVETHVAPADSMPFLADGEATVVFASNVFEHFPDKPTLLRVVKEIHRITAAGGRLIVIGPNIRFAASTYWDFFDHHVPLSDRSLSELLRASGFELERVVPRFLPMTVKSRLPRWRWLVEAYLLFRPIASLAVGRQFLVVARKPAS